MSYLDIKIQLYSSAEKSSRPSNWIPLRSFLFPSLDASQVVEDVRKAVEEGDIELKRKLKSRLPCVCISAIVEGERKEANVADHTGLLCIDVDGKDNPNFESGEDLKQYISRFQEVLYCGLSVSGQGCFAIIPIKHKDRHKGHFKALSRIIADRLGIRIDEACKDVTRLRFVSYDESPYLNESARVFSIVDMDEEAPVNRQEVGEYFSADTDLAEIEALVGQLEDRDIDLCSYRSSTDGTTDYATWLKMAFAFASLGEEGEDLFLRVCRLYPDHSEERSRRKFADALRSGRRGDRTGVTIASFVKFAREALKS